VSATVSGTETATGNGRVVQSGVANGVGNQTDVLQTSEAGGSGRRCKILGVMLCVGLSVVSASS